MRQHRLGLFPRRGGIENEVVSCCATGGEVETGAGGGPAVPSGFLRVSPEEVGLGCSGATEQILALLIAERDKLNLGIEVLERPRKRRGRPPKKPQVETSNAAILAPAKKKP